MPQKLRRVFTLSVLFIILAIIVLAYLPGTLDENYQGEDYLFVSQVARLGFAKAVITSWKDHFIPLYRFVMGGLHLLFDSPIPIRVAILGFHLANVALIFFIVRSHTRSTILAATAGVTFGLSMQGISGVLFPINGHWGMSLCFVLLMSVCFEKLLSPSKALSIEPDEGLEKSADKNGASPGTEPETPEALPSTRALTDLTLRPDPTPLKYYYLGLACFVVALGFFTNALSGGAVVWAFAYARLLRRREFRRSLRRQAKVVLPFVAIVAAYLLMRSHFNEISRPYVDTMTQLAMGRPEVTLPHAFDAIRNAPREFYSTAIERMLPYFPQRRYLILGILVLLLAKEMIFRRREAHVVLMWLVFALAVLAMPVVGRIFLVFKGTVTVDRILFPWYFYYPFAGVSVALGLLLRPPPFMENWRISRSMSARLLIFVMVAGALTSLNFDRAKEIRTVGPRLAGENLRFHYLMMQYKRSMKTFLRSPAYSPEREFYFQNTLAAKPKEFPMTWFVMQHDVFYLYFPHVKNIHFIISGWQYHGDLYMWSPDTIAKEHWKGQLR